MDISLGLSAIASRGSIAGPNAEEDSGDPACVCKSFLNESDGGSVQVHSSNSLTCLASSQRAKKMSGKA